MTDTAATKTTHWDAVVIGSGMGGLAAAAALSRAGHKVLVLEQYQTLGGQSHSFTIEGFTWDAGIHYLNCAAPEDRERRILDWLADAPIAMASMGTIYDTLHIGDTAPLSLSRPYEAQARDLKDRFPDEADSIDAWISAMKDGREAVMKVTATRAMPELVGTALKWWHSDAIERWGKRTTAEVVADLTDDPVLRAVFAAQWFDHGGRPSAASFAMHALITGSYLESGAWYPEGGGGTLAEHILPTIEKAGGAARAGTRVETLLMEDDRVVGVRTTDGEEIHADAVISDIGARETVNTLLPGDSGHQDWIDAIRALPHAVAHFSLFVGFEGDVVRAGATRSNHWIYPEGEVDVVWSDPLNTPPPALFVSFASLKDPEHDPGPSQKYAGEIVAWTDWSVIAPWVESPPGDRGEGYAAFKEHVTAAILARFRDYFPDLADLVVFSTLSTPLTTEEITGHHKGAFYGLGTTPDRLMSEALQTRTPIPGLFLAGQDVMTPGIPGALWGGLLAAATVDPKLFRQIPG